MLDGLVAGATELADVVSMYAETGFSVAAVQACFALEDSYRRFEALPRIVGPNEAAMENAKTHYFNAQRDCRRALDGEDVSPFVRSVRSADDGFSEIVGLASRLAN